jgi:hypothetical protein
VIEKRKKVYDKNQDSLPEEKRKVRYKYAPTDDIVNQVREYIAKNGLSYTLNVKQDEKMLTVVCRVKHILGHFEDSEFSVPIGSENFMSDVQKYGARSTFAKRYAFCNAFGIMTGDEDTDAVENKTQPQAPYSRPAQTEQPKNWVQNPQAPISGSQQYKLNTLISDCAVDEAVVLKRVNDARMKANPVSALATEINGLKMGEASQLIAQLEKKKEADAAKMAEDETKRCKYCGEIMTDEELATIAKVRANGMKVNNTCNGCMENKQVEDSIK